MSDNSSSSVISTKTDLISHNYKLSIQETTDSIQDFFNQQLSDFHQKFQQKQKECIENIHVQLKSELLKNIRMTKVKEQN